MAIGIVRTAWSGTTGGPGVTQFAVREGSGSFWSTGQAQNAVNAVRTFWDSVKALLPDEIVLTVSPTVDIYNEVNGDLTASVNASTPPTSVTGTSTAIFAMPVGMKMNLVTGVIRNGRRVRGCTYIVPASSVAFGGNGVTLSTARTTVNTAGTALITSLASSGLELSVYSRPRELPTPRAGALALVTGVETSEKAAVLRGRRD